MPVDERVTRVLKDAITILQQRGWSEKYNAFDEGPCNIRSAVLRAATDANNIDWHPIYLNVANALTERLGGIQHWEFGSTPKGKPRKLRTHDEVITKLTDILTALEQHETVPRRRSPGPTDRTV